MDIVLENDLVDDCKPGDRVAITGVYKTVSPRGGGMTQGVFKSLIVAVNVEKLTKEEQNEITEEVRRAAGGTDTVQPWEQKHNAAI